jgi:hypothetical protein
LFVTSLSKMAFAFDLCRFKAILPANEGALCLSFGFQTIITSFLTHKPSLMRKFTRLFSSIHSLLFLAGMLAGLSATAQATHALRITAPASVAGDYVLVMAAFGRGTCDLTDTLALASSAGNVTTACTTTPITANIRGKIAVIDRGGCIFAEKVLNAQRAGAIAVIVANNVATDPLAFVMSPGTGSEQVTIPVFMTTKAAADKIKPQLGTNVIARILTVEQDNIDPNTVVWGKNTGEGDFAGGLNKWTSNTLSCANGAKPANVWEWMGANAFPSPCLTDGTLLFGSPTRCNGSMIMNATTLDLNPQTCTSNAFGKGPCPAPHAGELISPTIKVTKGRPLNLRFYQELVHFFGSEYFVDWSTDGGKTWKAIQINEEVRAFDGPDLPYKSLKLVGSETADSIKVKFRYDGNFYHWAIDDVKLVARPSNDLGLTEFFATTPNMMQPREQAETMPFTAAVENLGTRAQTRVKVLATVADSVNLAVPLFRDSVVTPSLAANLIDTAYLAPKYSASRRGTYALVYRASADSTDFDRNDNLQGFFFRVTDTIFAKELGPTFYTSPAATNWPANQPHSAVYGNSYYVVKGKGNYLRSVTFSINNGGELRTAGASLLVSVYKWRDRNQDASVQASERGNPLGSVIYEPKGTETRSTRITVKFPETGRPPIQLEDTTTYLAMIEYFASDATDLELALNDVLDRRPQLLASFAANKPRFVSFTALEPDITTAEYDPVGYGLENAYVVRMNIGPLVITSNRDLPSIENEFIVSPNPASEFVNLNLVLAKSAKTAEVRILDLAGRVMLQRQYNNVQREQFQFALNALPRGTYLMQVTTEHGTGTRKFTVAGEQ